MKNRRISITLSLLTAIVLMLCMSGKKFSQIFRATTVDTNSYWVGTQVDTDGDYTDVLYSYAQMQALVGGGSGYNFANHDLDVTGNRFHRFHKYGMTWDSVYYFNYVDSFGDTIMAINNFFNPRNCIVRIGSYGNTGSFTVRTKDGKAGMSIVSPAATISDGTSLLQLSNPSLGINFARLGVNSVWGFVMDSITHNVYLGDWAALKGLQIDYTTGAVKVNNVYTLPLADGVPDAYLGTNGAGTTTFSLISRLGLITRYNGGAVAGNGVPAIRASTFHAGATTAAGIASITAAANVYEVGGYININSVTTDVLALRLVYTDVLGVVHTRDFVPNGSNVSTLSNVADYVFPRVEIMPQTGTAITLSAVLTTSGGSINYDYSGHIIQLN